MLLARILKTAQLPETTQCHPSFTSSTVSLVLPLFLRSPVVYFTYSPAILIWRSFVLWASAGAQRWCGCSLPGDARKVYYFFPTLCAAGTSAALWAPATFAFSAADSSARMPARMPDNA